MFNLILTFLLHFGVTRASNDDNVVTYALQILNDLPSTTVTPFCSNFIHAHAPTRTTITTTKTTKICSGSSATASTSNSIPVSASPSHSTHPPQIITLTSTSTTTYTTTSTIYIAATDSYHKRGLPTPVPYV
ncbi:hypothetical protein BDW02DRAFT_649405 [Decorospora gaudefroyi]|uniref:Uncharacterized protein n=1 Tax=Decorospora gaudefroyi TaxID=184978 RepID=A0A6A5K551_9PLEO|nr:hypothetical protein BDW02DRAFT_649405 [Decorospora gaudefroyi]